MHWSWVGGGIDAYFTVGAEMKPDAYDVFRWLVLSVLVLWFVMKVHL